jgi:chromosome segregation protein
MHLKRLEIEGFKTFATPTVLEFRPGITAIVGPNGSGKSNIADAVRWVLGEQSHAALRCKRTEELLFSGGGRRQPASSAEVSLTIDNSDHLLPLASSEITITRRATRSGGSEYFINRSRVTLREVQAATEPLGSAYTIINQGLVDLALTLRPEERRRLFESAAEIGSFEMRKQDAERRMRETDANIQRVADLLSELEPRLRSLKRQSAQARQHRELSAELHRLLVRRYTRQWQAAHAELHAAEQHAHTQHAALEQLRVAQAATTAELQHLREAVRHQREELGSLHQRYSQLHSRAEALQRELVVRDERLAALEQRSTELQRTHQDLEARAAETTREHASAQAALQAGAADLAQQRAHIATCEAETLLSAEARRTMEQELSAAQDAAMEAATNAATQRSRMEHLRTQRERLLQEQHKLAAGMQQAQEHLSATYQQVETLRASQRDAEHAREETVHAEEAARTELDTLRQQRATLDEQLGAARRTLTDAETRLDALNRLARSSSGTFPGVRAALQWAAQQGRSGFVLVSAIIRVPDGLETAIEVALGARLHNIVVERWQDAEDAIAELKRSGAGRATFLPLDTLRGRTHTEQRTGAAGPDAPVLGIASDLVACDDRYRIVVCHLLGRTLVVRDLKTARQEVRRLAGGWMIVTLGGEQVSSGGAMTGGAQTKEAGILQRERELRELPDQVEQTRAVIAHHEQQRHAVDEHIASATARLREAETRHREASRHHETQQSTLERMLQRASQSEQELAWRRDNYEMVAHDLEMLTTQEATLTRQQHEAEAHAAAAQEHLHSLRTRQEHEMQADRAAQEHLQTLRTRLASSEGQAQVQHSLIATHERTLQQLAHQQEQIRQQLAAQQTERTRILAARSSSEADYHALLHESDALQAQIRPAEAELRRYEARQAEHEQHESQHTVALLEQENSCNRATFELQRAQDRLEHLQERARADGVSEPLEMLAHAADAPAEPTSDTEATTDLHAEIERLRERLQRLGNINPLALEEYEEAAQHHHFQKSQLDDLRDARATLRELIGELDKTMHRRFVETFRAVAAEFAHYFTRLFGGGMARLELVRRQRSSHTATNGQTAVAHNGHAQAENPTHETATNGTTHESHEGDDSNDGAIAPHEYGIEITARPPGKRQQNLALLSGGERTLTATALLFALLTVNPSPFCILDEVDAALDESNVGRFRDTLHDLTTRTQFLLITHNRGTIEAASTLYGVTMGDDSVSRILSLRAETIEGVQG